jgi:multidrug efflux pump subunit AcrB
VAAAIAAADAKIPGGSIAGPERDLAVEIAGEIGDVARIRSIPLRTGAEGALLRVGDFAEISRAPREPPTSLARVEGGPAVLVAARMEADLQVERWAARARDTLAAFEAELPAGVEHRLLFDQSTYTDARFAGLGQNIAIGVGLVVLVLLVTLGVRAALVVAAVAAARGADLALPDAALGDLAAPDVGHRHDRRARPPRRRGHRDDRQHPPAPRGG